MAGKPVRRPSSNGRVSRQDWIDAACSILIERGIDDVRIGPLAARIGITRGSFYWHFAGLADLRQALLDDWEARSGHAIIRLRSRLSDASALSSASIEAMFCDDVTLPPFEMTLRLWAKRSADGRKVTERIDASWISVLQDILERIGFKSEDAAKRARFLYRFLFGLHITQYAIGADPSTFEFGDLVACPTPPDRCLRCVD